MPESLGGTLSKIQFTDDMFSRGAVDIPVASYLRPADVAGLELSKEPLANDLVLIKLAKKAPQRRSRERERRRNADRPCEEGGHGSA